MVISFPVKDHQRIATKFAEVLPAMRWFGETNAAVMWG
jgi:hypothetical protein